MTTNAERCLQNLAAIAAVTSDGQVTLLSNVGNTEDLIVTSLVVRCLAHQVGKSAKKTMSIDELMAAGGLTQRVARQTIYNSTSSLTKSKIIEKSGNEFFVGERTVMQYVASKLPALVKEA